MKLLLPGCIFLLRLFAASDDWQFAVELLLLLPLLLSLLLLLLHPCCCPCCCTCCCPCCFPGYIATTAAASSAAAACMVESWHSTLLLVYWRFYVSAATALTGLSCLLRCRVWHCSIFCSRDWCNWIRRCSEISPSSSTLVCLPGALTIASSQADNNSWKPGCFIGASSKRCITDNNSIGVSYTDAETGALSHLCVPASTTAGAWNRLIFPWCRVPDSCKASAAGVAAAAAAAAPNAADDMRILYFSNVIRVSELIESIFHE